MAKLRYYWQWVPTIYIIMFSNIDKKLGQTLDQKALIILKAI